MRAVIIALMLTVASPAVGAEIKVGDVYFCNMVQLLEIKEDDQWEIGKYKLENFKFQVTQNEIVFPRSGHFGNMILQKTFHEYELLEARSKIEARAASLALDARKSPVQFVYSSLIWEKAE